MLSVCVHIFSLFFVTDMFQCACVSGYACVAHLLHGFMYLAYLQSLSDCLQHVGDDGVVPEVSEPHPGASHVHGTRQEEAWPWGGKGQRSDGC